MTTVSQDKTHINQIIANDSKVASLLADLNTNTAEQLKSILLAFGSRNEDENGNLPSYILNQSVTAKDASVIGKLFSQYKSNGDTRADSLMKMAGSDYKRNKLSFLAALVMILMAMNAQQSLSIMTKYSQQDIENEISYMFGKGGDLHNLSSLKKSKKLIPNVNEFTRKDGTTISDNVYNTTGAIGASITGLLIAQIRKDQKLSDFNDFINSTNIATPVVSKSDASKPLKKRTKTVTNDINGRFKQLTANFSMNYRTWSAEIHSQLKLKVAKEFNITNATIINEFGPCNECVPYIGQEMSVEEATGLVPIHNNCRCEVKLLLDGTHYEDVDDE